MVPINPQLFVSRTPRQSPFDETVPLCFASTTLVFVRELPEVIFSAKVSSSLSDLRSGREDYHFLSVDAEIPLEAGWSFELSKTERLPLGGLL